MCGVARREQPQRRPPERRRAGQVAPLARDDVGPRVAGRAQQPQRERIRDRHEQRPRVVRRRRQRFQVGDRAQVVGLLRDQAGVLVGRRIPRRHDVDPQPGAARVRPHDLRRAGVDRLQQRDGPPPRDARRQQAGLGGRAGDVVEARVRHVHARQLAHDRLVLEAGLQRALTDLRLVRRVRRRELRPPAEVRGDGRDRAPVRARAAEVGPRRRRVGGRPLLEQRDQLRLRERRRQFDRGVAQRRRQVVEQRLHVGHADPRQHPRPVRLGGRDVWVRRSPGRCGRQRQLSGSCARYAAASSSPSTSAASAMRTRISQPDS